MLEELFEALQPALLVAIEGLATLLIGWLMMRLPPAVRTYVERNHREALHSALMTAARNALDDDPNTDPAEAVSTMTAHVRESVPDAINALKPSRQVLENLARSKLRDVRAALRAG